MLIENVEPDDLERPYAHYRDGWRLNLAYDHGSSAPAVCYLVGESPGCEHSDGRLIPRDSVVLFDEIATHMPGSLEKGMGYTVPRLADEIKELASRWGIKPEGVADDSMFAGTAARSDRSRRSSGAPECTLGPLARLTG